MMKKTTLALLNAIVLLQIISPMTATAQSTPGTGSTAYRFDEVVVTATRGEKSLDEVTADVEILSAQDIKAAPTSNIDDMLRRFSGVEMTRSSDMTVTFPMSTSIRGVSGANRVLYMVDGMPINSALTGFVIPGIIQPETIERIEVVKGAFSALYGSNAMGGVINIITKKRTMEGRSEMPYISAGSDGFREAGIRLEAKKDRLSGSINAGYRSIRNHYRTDRRVKYSYNPFSGGFTTRETDTVNAVFRDRRFAGRLDYQVSDRTTLMLSGGYTESDTGMGRTTHLPRERDRNMNRTLYYLNLTAQTLLFDELELETRLYTNYDRTETDDENMVEHQGFFGSRYSYEYGDQDYWGRDTGLQLKAATPLSCTSFLTAGIDLNFKEAYWKNRGSDGRVIDRTMDEDMTTQALYLQHEIELFERLTVTLGGRFDANSESESSFSPKMGILYRLNDRIQIRGSIGRAFRAPTLTELHQPTWQMIPGVPFMSNPDLDPEVIWSYDLGISVKIHKNASFKLTAFYTDAEDLITAVITNGVMRYENVNKIETDGFEVGLEVSPVSWLKGYANYTYTHAVDKEQGRLGDTPLHRVNAGVQTVHRIAPRAVLTTALDVRFTDSMFYQDRMTKNLLEMDAFTIADLTVQLDLFDRLNIKAVVTNLTDEEYEQHNADAGPERAYWVKCSCKF